MATGELICIIAMTELTTGLDLQNIKTYVVKDGDDYIINSSKTLHQDKHQATVGRQLLTNA